MYLYSTAIESNKKIKYIFYNCDFNKNKIGWDLESFLSFNKLQLENYKTSYYDNIKIIIKNFIDMNRKKKLFILVVLIIYILFTIYTFEFFN